MIKIIIFKKNGCAPCKALTDDIDNYKGPELNNIDLFYADMTRAPDDIVELSVKYNVRSAPTTVILAEDDSVIYNGTMVKTAKDLISKMS
jgi:thioredoxin-related protein